jgi:tRNA (cytosine38-C5)-methyltransferase
LLSPDQFGIPNSRLRYFLIATYSDSEKFHGLIPEKISDQIEDRMAPIKCSNLDKYLEDKSQISSELFLEESILWSYGHVLDIVQPSSNRSCCFTKSYYNYIEGTGSVLQTDQFDQTETCLLNFEQLRYSRPTCSPCPLNNLRLRYFTPKEISLLHGFPKSFEFPPHLEVKQCFRLIGNSLNVSIVSWLLNKVVINPKHDS